MRKSTAEAPWSDVIQPIKQGKAITTWIKPAGRVKKRKIPSEHDGREALQLMLGEEGL